MRRAQRCEAGDRAAACTHSSRLVLRATQRVAHGRVGLLHVHLLVVVAVAAVVLVGAALHQLLVLESAALNVFAPANVRLQWRGQDKSMVDSPLWIRIGAKLSLSGSRLAPVRRGNGVSRVSHGVHLIDDGVACHYAQQVGHDVAAKT